MKKLLMLLFMLTLCIVTYTDEKKDWQEKLERTDVGKEINVSEEKPSTVLNMISSSSGITVKLDAEVEDKPTDFYISKSEDMDRTIRVFEARFKLEREIVNDIIILRKKREKEIKKEEKKIVIHEKIIFNDLSFENEIRRIINKPEGIIYTDDVEQIEELFLSFLEKSNSKDDKNVDIDAIKYFVNLKQLRIIGCTDINIINLKTISKLKKLKILGLVSCEISDISLISELEGLQYLNLWGNRISTNLEKISQLKNLKVLTLGFENGLEFPNLNKLENLAYLKIFQYSSNRFKNKTEVDIEKISKLEKLVVLNIWGEEFKNIKLLANLHNLKGLDMAGCGLTDISFVGELKELNYLDLGMNKISDVSCLTKCKKLEYLRLDFNNIEVLDNSFKNLKLRLIGLVENPLKDVEVLKSMGTLAKIGIYIYDKKISDEVIFAVNTLRNKKSWIIDDSTTFCSQTIYQIESDIESRLMDDIRRDKDGN